MGTYVQLWSGNGTLQTFCALSYVRQSAAPIRIFAKLLDFRTAGKLKKCQDAPPMRSRPGLPTELGAAHWTNMPQPPAVSRGSDRELARAAGASAVRGVRLGPA